MSKILFMLCVVLFLTLFLEASQGKFDWSVILVPPPGIDPTPGNQILHFGSKNKPYWENEAARTFVETYLQEAVVLRSDAEVLKFGSDRALLKGMFLELGVCTGRTINFIAALNPHFQIYGFDSFEGLPEDWIRGDILIRQGTFGFKNSEVLPPVLHNVELVKGWFSDTLPEFLKTRLSNEPIAFLHVDSDLYSSAAFAFEVLGDRIQPGTVIVFDEFYNYLGSENHELKAFQEFVQRRNLQFKYLAYNMNHEQVAVEIVSAHCQTKVKMSPP